MSLLTRHLRQVKALAALGCLASVSAAAPGELAFRVTDQNGLPLYQAVVEVARPAGDRQPVAFPWRAAMAQRNLAFLPGTLIVPVGSNVAFPNLDTVRHSIYSFSRTGRFQIDLYGREQTRTQRFEVAGTAVLGCNIHDQMRGYVRVTTTPYANLTDAGGRTAIRGLGPGSYRVTVWHPRLRGADNVLTQTVTARPGQPIAISVPVR
jgi:plastocyanin